jgi:hypothetical protein
VGVDEFFENILDVSQRNDADVSKLSMMMMMMKRGF